MANQIINVGAVPNDGTGDTLRVAFIKTRDNFAELYNLTDAIPVDVSDLTDTGNLLFDGSYDSLNNLPTIPSDISDLTDTQRLLGGENLRSRNILTSSTGSIDGSTTANIDLVGYKGYLLYKVETSAAAWVRLYVNAAARTADANRPRGQDPLPGSGVIVEVITSGAETVIIAPGVVGFNAELPVTNIIPIAVDNLDVGGATVDIAVTLTAVELEV